MKISYLDHLVLTVADIEKSIDFYTRVLGMRAITFGDNRKALVFGQQKINLHQKGKEFEPKAKRATPGSADLCFITTLQMELIVEGLQKEKVEILQGPISRSGATSELLSIYLRDPDQNLIEISNEVPSKKIIDKLAYIHLKEGRILVSRSKGKKKFYIPGGKRDPGENDIEALSREVKEELSVDIMLESIRYAGTFYAQAHGHADGVQVKMTCYEADYQGVLMAASEIEEIRWLGYTDIELVSYVDKIIFNHLKNIGSLE